MILNDLNIVKYFFKPKTYKFIDFKKLNNIPQDIKTYLINRFNDSYSIKETIYRIKYISENINVEHKPKCPICGNPVIFLNKRTRLYTECCSVKCKKILDKDKIKQTNNKKYGGNAPICSQDIKDKIKQTNNKKYGVDHIWKNKDYWQKTRETTIKKFGSAYNKEKYIQTYILKYNIESLKNKNNVTLSDLCKSIEYKNHMYEVKKKNHTFNTSKIEIDTYNLLKEKYPDVIYQYKDKQRYPFICDFYIPSLDLFIECNYHWTHGGKPYEGTINDNNKLQEWKNKNTKYYDNAINCWTIRDVNKRKIAKQNKLNYLEVWNINEIKIIFNKI